MSRRDSGTTRRYGAYLASSLREEAIAFDDVRRHRIERAICDARSHAASPLAATSSSRSPWRWPVLGLLAASLAVSTAVLIVSLRPGVPAADARSRWEGRAVLEVFARDSAADDVLVGSVPLAEGDTLDARSNETLSVRIAASELRLAPSSVARLTRLGEDAVDLRLEEGRVDVTFHPTHRGKERWAVETRWARVEVVGTVFRVVATSDETQVAVTDGVVRVISRRDGSVSWVRAGEQVSVLGDDTESGSFARATHRRDDEAADPALDSRGVTTEGRGGTEAMSPIVGSVSMRPSEDAVPDVGGVDAGRSRSRGAVAAARTRVGGVTKGPRLAEAARVGRSGDASGVSELARTGDFEDHREIGSTDGVVPESDGAVESATAAHEAPSAGRRGARTRDARPRSAERLFHRVRALERLGEPERARHILYGIARDAPEAALRARAWLWIAYRWVDLREYEMAAEACVRSARVAPDSADGRYAWFQLGMLRERYQRDRDGAERAYRTYLEVAPTGQLVVDARRRLCELGQRSFCGGRDERERP